MQKITDFEKIPVGEDGLFYFGLRFGKFELTIEPMMFCDFDVGLYQDGLFILDFKYRSSDINKVLEYATALHEQHKNIKVN